MDLEKILMVSEKKKVSSSTLRRSKENNFLYHMVTVEMKIE